MRKGDVHQRLQATVTTDEATVAAFFKFPECIITSHLMLELASVQIRSQLQLLSVRLCVTDDSVQLSHRPNW